MLITDSRALNAEPEKWPHTDELNNAGYGAIVLGNLEKNLIFYTQIRNNLQS